MTGDLTRKSWPTMQHFFTKEGQQALAHLLRHEPLMAFDFDGTLAPIVTRPEQARISRGVVARLSLLAQQLPVAIITGRAINDVQSRLGFKPQYIVGNHGAEDPADPLAAAALRQSLAHVRDLLAHAASGLGAAGVSLEDKGQSIALHYRLARNAHAAMASINEFVQQLDARVHVFPGKMVVNIAPAGAPNKSDALLALMRRINAEHAFFAGDDANDEPVFSAALPSWLTLRIGRDDPASTAMYYINNALEMARLLDQMLDHLGQDAAP